MLTAGEMSAKLAEWGIEQPLELYIGTGGGVGVGLGRLVALYYHSSNLYRFTNILGTSISEATMRPNPRR